MACRIVPILFYTPEDVFVFAIISKGDSIKTVIKWKERIVYRDSIEKVEVPVPVEVTKEVTKYPKTYWWFMGFTILTALYVALKIYMRIKFHKTI